MNVVMTSSDQFVEIQGTAESKTFSEPELQKMLELAKAGCRELFNYQKQIIGEFFPLKG
jgi:ribonuclease PH